MNESRFPRIEVQLREALWADLKNLWIWRNDPVTRSGSLSHDYIYWANHAAWFSDICDSPDRKLMIAESHGFPVGTIRFDYGPDDVKLNWTVAPEYRHQGIGRAIVAAAIKAEPKRMLVAWVMPHNKASLRIAESLGFVEESRSFSTIVLTRKPE